MKLIYFLANNPCEDPEILKIIYYIRFIVSVAFTVIPIILIVMMIVDFIKSVSAGNEDVMKKNQKVIIKRILYCLMVFFVMPIVNATFSLFKTAGQDSLISQDGVNYLTCWANADDIATIELLTINASFNAGEGGIVYGGSSQYCGGISECELMLPNATKNGYFLSGWTKNGGSEVLKAGKKVIINDNDTFEAIWVEMEKYDDYVSNEDIINSDNTPKPSQKPEGDGDSGTTDNGGNSSGNVDSSPSTPIVLSNDVETRITQMIDFAKTLEGYSLSEFNSELGGSYSGYWCSWFVFKLYEKFGFSYDIDFYSDDIPYACGWIELEDGAYNGYFRRVETGNLDYVPQPGDLILFNEPGDCASHVGMVTAVDENYIHTVEGNWDNKVSILERDIPTNGDGKYIDNGDGFIIGYYSIRKLISMNN